MHDDLVIVPAAKQLDSAESESMQYDPAFVANRPILTQDDKTTLRRWSDAYPLARFLNDTRNYDETVVDVVYTSGKIEGNTYDQIDTANLLRMGITAGGKRYSDAVMLVNLRAGFEQVVRITPAVSLDRAYVTALHRVLMDGLLPAREQGIVRQQSVTITGTASTPLVDFVRLDAELRFLLDTAAEYADPFEQAIFLHCNLAYLQYFTDGNKRTARLMQTAALARGGQLPLFFSDKLIETHIRATLTYCETGDYAPYVAFFKENYLLAISRLLGHPPDEANGADPAEWQRRIDNVPKLQKEDEAAYVFREQAEQALSAAAGDTRAVRWWEVEIATIDEGIGDRGLTPESVADALIRYSPDAAAPAHQTALRESITRLAPLLQGQKRDNHIPNRQEGAPG